MDLACLWQPNVVAKNESDPSYQNLDRFVLSTRKKVATIHCFCAKKVATIHYVVTIPKSK
jgi:hypothetical protein